MEIAMILGRGYMIQELEDGQVLILEEGLCHLGLHTTSLLIVL